MFAHSHNHRPLPFRRSTRVRTRLAQRAVIAAVWLEQNRTSSTHVADLLGVSVRSIGRAQQLLREACSELLSDVVTGKLTLTEAVTTITAVEDVLLKGGVRGLRLTLGDYAQAAVSADDRG